MKKLCPLCGSPLSISEGGEGRMIFCPRCGYIEEESSYEDREYRPFSMEDLINLSRHSNPNVTYGNPKYSQYVTNPNLVLEIRSRLTSVINKLNDLGYPVKAKAVESLIDYFTSSNFVRDVIELSRRYGKKEGDLYRIVVYLILNKLFAFQNKPTLKREISEILLKKRKRFIGGIPMRILGDNLFEGLLRAAREKVLNYFYTILNDYKGKGFLNNLYNDLSRLGEELGGYRRKILSIVGENLKKHIDDMVYSILLFYKLERSNLYDTLDGYVRSIVLFILRKVLFISCSMSEVNKITNQLKGSINTIQNIGIEVGLYIRKFFEDVLSESLKIYVDKNQLIDLNKYLKIFGRSAPSKLSTSEYLAMIFVERGLSRSSEEDIQRFIEEFPVFNWGVGVKRTFFKNLNKILGYTLRKKEPLRPVSSRSLAISYNILS